MVIKIQLHVGQFFLLSATAHHVGHFVGNLVYLHVDRNVQLHVGQFLFNDGNHSSHHVGHLVYLNVGHYV